MVSPLISLEFDGNHVQTVSFASRGANQIFSFFSSGVSFRLRDNAFEEKKKRKQRGGERRESSEPTNPANRLRCVVLRCLQAQPENETETGERNVPRERVNRQLHAQVCHVTGKDG